MRFYAHESCGQCTPCREGTGWLARVCTRAGRRRGPAPATSTCWRIDRARHRRQHHLRARRRRGVADARLPHQVPRRLRGQDPQGPPPEPRAGAAQPPLVQIRGTGYRARRCREAARERALERCSGPAASARHRRRRRLGWSGPDLFWWILAALTVVGAVSPSRGATPVAAVMWLVATFFGLAAMYVMLSRTSSPCCRCWSTPAPSWCCSSSSS